MKLHFLHTSKNAIRYLAKQVFKNLLITTKAKSGERSFVTIGSHKSHARYQYLYLGSETNVTNTLKFNFCIRKSLPDLLIKSGLVIIKNIDLAKSIKDQVLMQPNFIDLEIPLPKTLDEYYKMVTGDARNNLKKIKKTGFRFGISSDKGWVDQFYSQYYLPSMVGRHADDAYVMPKNEIMSLMSLTGAEFLNVFLNDECVASAIAIHEGEKYTYAKVGWLNGDNVFLEQGVTTAIYQILIERAFELGCKKISLGGTPPFLESGVLKYKAKWQPRLCADIYYSENFILLNPSNSNCYEFLQNNSLIAFGLDDKLIVLSSKLIAETRIPGLLLNDINSWYLLRKERSLTYPNGMEDLPEHLRYWFDKI